jgi:hypothetical protein
MVLVRVFAVSHLLNSYNLRTHFPQYRRRQRWEIFICIESCPGSPATVVKHLLDFFSARRVVADQVY